MKRFWQYVKNYPLIFFFFILISISLWVSDGQQTLVDIVLAVGMILLLYITPHIAIKKRPVNPKQLIIGTIFLVYVCIRTLTSDDIGSSLYVAIRYLSVAGVYYLFFCYTTRQTISVFIHSVFGWTVFAILSSLLIMVFPQLNYFKGMNLLTAQYAHHLVIVPILFSFAPSIYLWMTTKKPLYLILAGIFFLGSILSFSRAALVSEGIIIWVIVLLRYLQTHRIRLIDILMVSIVTVGLISLFTLPYATRKDSAFAKLTLKQQDPMPDRINYWSQAITAIKEQPFWGYGPGTFFIQSTRLQPKTMTYVLFTHNSILEQLVDLGSIGVLPLVYLLVVIGKAWLKNRTGVPEKQTYIIHALIISVFSILLYSMGDFPLNFFAPLLLFWAILGVVSGISEQKNTEKHLYATWILRIGVIFLTFSTILIIFDQLLVTWKISPCEHIRGLQLQICLMRKTNGTIPITKQDLHTYEMLHKNNPAVLYTIGYIRQEQGQIEQAKELFKKAIQYYPHNLFYYSEYLSLEAQEHTESLGKLLESYSCKTVSKTLCQQIQQFDLSSPKYSEILTSILSPLQDGTRIYQDYAVIFYRLGLFFLPTQPRITEQFWQFLVDAYPQTGAYYTELASLYTYIFHDPKKAEQILTTCLTYRYPKEECSIRLRDGLPTPGSLEQSIRTKTYFD